MRITSLDHLVLTVRSIEASVAFYCDGLGMHKDVFGPDQRVALAFGSQKINLHQAGKEFEPKSDKPTPGSGDLCFLVDSVDVAIEHLQAKGIVIIDGPVARTGATGPISSIYLRDPDGNLIELSELVR